MQVAILGATGTVGRRLAALASDRGHRMVVAGRDATRLRTEMAGLNGLAAVVEVDPDQPAQVREFASRADVLLSAVGGPPARRTAAVTAALEAGAHAVGAAATPRTWRMLEEHCGGLALENGLTVLPSGGIDLFVADLVAAVTAARIAAPRTIHVSYAVPGRPGLIAAGTRTSRNDVLEALQRPLPALAHGGHRSASGEERAGEQRRLAWFPRPLGPHHVVAVPGSEALALPLHLPQVATVGTFVAMRSWQAELFQMAVSMLQRPAARERLRRALVRRPSPTPDEQAATRWACVVEVGGDGDDTARGWAYGHDPYGVTAAGMMVAAEAMAAGDAPAGVVPPALAVAAEATLDQMTEATDLRWQVRPVGSTDEPNHDVEQMGSP